MKTNLLFSVLTVLIIFSLCGSASAGGLVAHWKLDESQGSIAYDSANGFDGTLVNGPLWTAGQIDGALSFDGTQAVYINGSAGYDSPLNIYNTNMTISAWIKPGLNASTIIARAKPHYTTYRLYVGGGKVGINTYRSPVHWNLSTGEILDPNNWSHVVGVLDRDNDTCIIYVNGIEQARSTQMTTDPPSCDAPTKIGCRNDTGDYTFDGLIDDVRIYDYALDANEIQNLYQESACLVAHWKFDEGTGTTAYDSAGTNNGTISGPVWAAGQIGGALEFDGVNDYVNMGSDSSLKPDLPVTLSAWVRLDEINRYNFIIFTDNRMTRYYGIWFYVANNNNTLQLGYGDGGIKDMWHRRSKAGTTALLHDVWYHVAAVVKGPKDMSIYINGVDDGGTYSGTGGTLAYSADGDVFVGTSGGDNLCYLDGLIDDVRIYNCALDANQVAKLYVSGLPSLQGINIVGPNSVPEESDTQYNVIGRYDNGSSSNITADTNLAVVPDEFAVIDANGLLATDRLYRQKEICTIYAYYQGFSASKPVTIYPLCDGNECTGPQLLKRNIADAIEIKQDVIGQLEYARKIEFASFQLLGKIAVNPQYRRWSSARIQILAAWAYEAWAVKKVDESIDLLETADGIMR